MLCYFADGEVGEDLVVEVYVLFHLRIMVVLFIIIFKILKFRKNVRIDYREPL